MKHFKLLAIAVAAALASAAAFAQTATNAPAAGGQHAQLDANKDGLIDRAEAAKARIIPELLTGEARSAQRRAECFGKADADKNGQLSRAEFDRMGEACGPMRDGIGKRQPRNNPNPGPFPPRQ